MDRARVGRGAFKYLMMMAFATTATFGALTFGERPADLSPSAKAVARVPSQLDLKAKPHVLPIECWDKLSAVTVPPSTKWVRITGRVCEGPVVGLDAILVTNETNHTVATIFPLDHGLTTDLVPLVEGRNELTFSIAREGGPVVGHLTLEH